MIVATDVYYYENSAKAVGVLFNWEDEKESLIYTCCTSSIEDYVPGAFYKRELPCLLELLKQIDLNKLEAIIVDGHVFVDNKQTYGLGGHLFSALDERIPVIGIAKRKFYNTEKVSFPVVRGESKNPLYVSAIGIDEQEAIRHLENMHGDYRMPSILKLVDQETRK